MPNLCDYTIKVKGKKENVETFLNYLDNDYHYIEDKNLDSDLRQECEKKYKLHFVSQDKKIHLFTNHEKHMYRIFDVYFVDEGESDGKFYSIATGDCAWSVYNCMFDGAHTYYAENVESSDLRQEHSTTIPILSQELDLDIEIYSTEIGMEFAEHFLVEKGKIIKDECFRYEEIYKEDYPDKSEMEKKVEREISDDDWKYGEFFYHCEINPHDPEWSI